MAYENERVNSMVGTVDVKWQADKPWIASGISYGKRYIPVGFVKMDESVQLVC
jgi:hypothetical protein